MKIVEMGRNMTHCFENVFKYVLKIPPPPPPQWARGYNKNITVPAQLMKRENT